MKFLSFLSMLGLLSSTIGCYYDNLEELHPELLLNSNCDTTAVQGYQTHLQPILSNSFGANNSCHNAQGAGGGVILETYPCVKDSVAKGQILSSITLHGNAQQMPKSSPSILSDCSIEKIQKWIDAGPLNN